MSNLTELYHELILDHSKHPRNFGDLAEATNFAHGHNPLCGDKLEVYLLIEEGVIREVKFSGSGCAISVASASLMTECLKGKSAENCFAVYEVFRKIVMDGEIPKNEPSEIENLSIFSGVRQFPIRVKCATLAWHAMRAAIEQSGERISTE